MKMWTVTEKIRLDHFVVSQLPEHSRSRLTKLIESGEILVNDEVRKPGFELRPGMVVTMVGMAPLPIHDMTPADIPIPVIYEDDDLLIVNKPRGLATHPAPGLREPTLVNALLGQQAVLSSGSSSYRPGIVHRLDKETTGLLIVAKTEEAHRDLAEQIAVKSAERRYVAVCVGSFDKPGPLRIQAPIARDKTDRRKMAVDPKGKHAATVIQVLKDGGDRSLLGVKLETGRTHQIRVHLMAIGHPVFGDVIYAPAHVGNGALQLHAAFLGITHPITKERLTAYVEPPSDFQYYDLVSKELMESL